MKIKKVSPVWLLLTVLSFWFGCSSDNEMQETENKIPVKTAKVIQKEISIPIHSSGILSTAKEIKLSFKIGGIVERILVDEGQTVKKNQLLAELNQREIQAQVNHAQSAFEKSQRDYQRLKNLYADNVVTLEQLQNTKTGLDVAKSNLEIAQFNLKHSKIVAPSDGTILKRFVEANELVGPGIPIFYFGVTGDAWRVKMGITDQDIVLLQLGDSASVSFDTYPGKHFPARVTEIAESADPMSGTFEVETQLGFQKIKLVSGFVAKIDLFPSKRQKYYWIPVEAMVEADEGKAYVFSPIDEKAVRIQINVVSISDQYVAVEAGLEGVTEVITDGAPYLVNGSEIEIVNE